MSAKKVIVRVALTVVVLLVALPMIAIVVTMLSSLARAAEPALGKLQACEQACREAKPQVKKKRQSPCVTVELTVVPGDEVRFFISAPKRLPSSACSQVCDGNDCAAPPSPCDDCSWISHMPGVARGFLPLHSGKYVARSAKQKFRFPRAAMTDYIAFCVTRGGLGQSNAAVVLPPTWGKSSIVKIPAQGFPLWGPENVGRVVVPAASDR
ncbi:MAG: hypothetical protein WCT45_03220 [Candidatus Paceibacterota bacterium]|jgi:hypothetical protein